jgi:hypothetical protein
MNLALALSVLNQVFLQNIGCNVAYSIRPYSRRDELHLFDMPDAALHNRRRQFQRADEQICQNLA